jgi:hypothetical protein
MQGGRLSAESQPLGVVSAGDRSKLIGAVRMLEAAGEAEEASSGPEPVS